MADGGPGIQGIAAWGDRDLEKLQLQQLKSPELQCVWAFSRQLFRDLDPDEPLPEFIEKHTIDCVRQLSEKEVPVSLGWIDNGVSAVRAMDGETDVGEPGPRFPLCLLHTRAVALW
jgi:hypothetical protein